ncbi:MAG: hypothetical protein LBF74_05310 [Treponema sp.]|jgi:hypothetical protein|nr:hypothetical protein [Treponema sp.]
MTRRFIGRVTAAALVMALCAASCASTKSGPPVPQTTEAPPAEIVQESRDLFNRSFDEQYSSGYWVTRPSRGTIPVVGISGRRNNRNEAIQAAVADAARKVALYHGLYAASAAVLNQGSGYLDYFADFDYRLTIDNDPSVYTGSLVFDKDDDVYEKNGSLYVRVKYTGVADVPAYASVFENGVPDWVKNYRADVPGFLTGVGASRNKGSPQATSRASYESAIISLLPELTTKVAGSVHDAAGGKVQQNITTSQGNLTKVMILETWFDSKTGSVWTLLVAKERR